MTKEHITLLKDLSTPGACIAEAIKMSGKPVLQVANDMGKSAATVYRYINDVNSLPLEDFGIFCQAVDNTLLIEWIAFQHGLIVKPIDDEGNTKHYVSRDEFDHFLQRDAQQKKAVLDFLEAYLKT
jgi:hypothetical protein